MTGSRRCGALGALLLALVASPSSAEFAITGNTKEIQENVRGCSDASGSYVVVWDSGLDPARSDARVLARRFDREGAPLGLEFQVSAGSNGQRNPSVACQADGSFLVVWTDDASSSTSGRFFDATGAPLAPEFTVNAVAAPPIESVGACALPGGAYLAAWQSAAHPDNFFVRRFTTAGSASAELGVDGGGAATVANGRLVCSAAGDALVAWRDETAGVDRGQPLDGTPALVGSAFVFDTSPQAGAPLQDLVMAPDGWLLAQWLDAVPAGLPRARRYSAAGVPLAPSFQSPGPCCGDTLAAIPPAAITSENEILLVVDRFPHGEYVRGYTYDADQTPIGGDLVFSSGREKRDPRRVIAGKDDDVLVVLAQSSGPDRLYGRLFNTRPISCSPTPLTGCYPAAAASFVVSNPTGDQRDHMGWKATKVTGGPARREVVSGHIACVYDQHAGTPALVHAVGGSVYGTCGLFVDSSCWKITARGGLRWKHGDSISVDPTKVSMDTRFLRFDTPFSATEYYDQDPAVIVQLSNTRGECWSTAFTSAKKNTAEIYRAAQ